MRKNKLILLAILLSYTLTMFSQKGTEKIHSVKVNVLSSLATIPLGGFMFNVSYEQSTKFRFNSHITFQYFTEDMNSRPHQIDFIFEPRYYSKTENLGFHYGPYLRYYLLSVSPEIYSYGAIGGVTGYKLLILKKIELDFFGGVGIGIYEPGGAWLDDMIEIHENETTASKADFRIGINVGYIF